MRTLCEIVEDVKSGLIPSGNEMRYAICALDALLTFDQLALMRLDETEKENKPKILTGSAVWQHNESLKRNHTAFNKSPKEWIGWNNDPDNPEYIERRKAAVNIFNRINKKQ